MPQLHFTQNDFNKTEVLAGLLKKIDAIEYKEVNLLYDEIYTEQPFLLSVLLGYRFDVSTIELDEIIKLYLLIWKYFKMIRPEKRDKITESQFTKIEKRNIQMLNYANGEDNENDKQEIYSADLLQLKSKALVAAILFRLNERPPLMRMNTELKGTILIGVKSFIECFESV